MLNRLFLGLILISSQVSSVIDFNDSGLNKQALFVSAVGHGKIELAEALIKAGVNVNYINKNGAPILLIARTLEMIKILLNAGANVNIKANENSWPVLAYCNFLDGNDAEEKVRLLIAAGADVNVRCPQGQTVLMHYAVNHCGYNIILTKLLIAAGADVNVKNDKGETALILTMSRLSSIELIELLIAAGADVNIKNNKGETALMVAVMHRRIELIELLINAGADANVKNNEGQTLLDIACETFCIPAIEFLQNYYKEQTIKKSLIEIQNNSDNSISVLHNTEVPAHSKAVITTEISKT